MPKKLPEPEARTAHTMTALKPSEKLKLQQRAHQLSKPGKRISVSDMIRNCLLKAKLI